jgi:hypothetical protein
MSRQNDKGKESTRNITLSLPTWLLRRVKVLAAEQETSVSRLLSKTLEEIVTRNDAYEQARERARRLLRNPPDLGTFERNWTRDDLHER